MSENRRHPLAMFGHKNGALGMKAGGRVIYNIDGRHGRADEFLHDGDAFVVFDDGSFETVKWNHLSPEKTQELKHEDHLGYLEYLEEQKRMGQL